ncbi:MAG: metal-dependent transcriptional regulator [Phaeodactylibacter sp.]|nr:metal-dependent transcriptional regulator [Phaeodactylibacter sp.]
MSTTAKENYLKALYSLDEEYSAISLTELSKRLQVSKPTASNMMKRLYEDGLVDYQKYKPLQLTLKGRQAAANVIRKHRLTEMFLYEIMSFGWEEVHEIAEQMEHIDSEKLFSRMDEMLDRPSFDPHGSPIPDKDGKIVRLHLPALINIAPGKKGRLTAIQKSSAGFLNYLNQQEIKLGVQIELIKVEAFDQSCQIRISDRAPFTISRKVAENLLVELT